MAPRTRKNLPEKDPFAAPDEAQTELPQPDTEEVPVPEVEENDFEDYVAEFVPVAGKDEVVVTLKGGTGYDAPWVVLHSATVEGVIAQMQDVEQFERLLRAVSWASKKLQEGNKPAPQAQGPANGGNYAQNRSQGQYGGGNRNFQNRGGNNGGYQRQAPNTSPPDSEPRYCQHGQRQWASGVDREKGTTWGGWMCALPAGTPGRCKGEYPPK